MTSTARPSGRIPAWTSRLAIHSGASAFASTPRTARSVKRVQPSVSTASGNGGSPVAAGSTVFAAGSLKATPRRWATSRAMPRTEKQ